MIKGSGPSLALKGCMDRSFEFVCRWGNMLTVRPTEPLSAARSASTKYPYPSLDLGMSTVVDVRAQRELRGPRMRRTRSTTRKAEQNRRNPYGQDLCPFALLGPAKLSVASIGLC